jgi:hypothetical protein
VEERRLIKENASQPLLVRTQSRVTKSRGLLGVRETARKDKKTRFNNLLNHVTTELLQASFVDLKKNAAPGIDGETWSAYAEDFETRIIDLRIMTGCWSFWNILGFTHICGKTRKGDFTIKRISAIKKLRSKVKELKDELHKRMHMDLATVGSWLRSVYRGWCQYHAIPGNYDRLQQLRTALQELWFRRLRRRSQRGRSLTWPKFSKLSRNWLPTPKILHPYPNERFNRLHPR